MEILYFALSGLFLFWGVKALFPTPNHAVSFFQGGFTWDGLVFAIVLFFGGSAGFLYLGLTT